jgi:hypothetical protein
LHQLSASVTTKALLTEDALPNFTLPFYEVTAGYAVGMGGFMALAYAPLVKAEDRAGWEAYSEREQGWIAESLHLEEVHLDHQYPMAGTFHEHFEEDELFLGRRRRVTEAHSIHPYIFHWEENERVPDYEYEGDKIFAPLWQVTPASIDPVNLNLFDDPVISHLYRAMDIINQTVLSEPIEINGHALFEYLFVGHEEDRWRPYSYVLNAVYDTFETNDRHTIGKALGVVHLDERLSLT